MIKQYIYRIRKKKKTFNLPFTLTEPLAVLLSSYEGEELEQVVISSFPPEEPLVIFHQEYKAD